jgi:AcrR family transcriptional regulator
MAQVQMMGKQTRDVGRPRSFSDEEAFLATTRLLIEHGAAGITLADLARSLGCTAPALNVRFGSRTGLLRAYYAWATQLDRDRFARSREKHSSPLKALRNRLLQPANDEIEKVLDASSQAKLLSIFAEAQRDPAFADLVSRRNILFEQEIAASLNAAVEAGELKQADTKQLAHLLYSGIVGAGYMWSVRPEGPVAEEIGAILDAVISPYESSGKKRK